MPQPATTAHTKRQHAAKSALLTPGELIIRMARQARVIDGFKLRLPFKPLRQIERTATVGLHAQPQGLQPLEKNPGIEMGSWSDRRSAEIRAPLPYAAEEPTSDATDTTALAIEILGRRMHHDVRTELQRLLQRRRAETIIDYQQDCHGCGPGG